MSHPPYRAVSPDEANDILKTGQFGPSQTGSEVKWFFTNPEDARWFGETSYESGNYSVFQGDFPASATQDNGMIFDGRPGFVVPNGMLPQGTPYPF